MMDESIRRLIDRPIDWLIEFDDLIGWPPAPHNILSFCSPVYSLTFDEGFANFFVIKFPATFVSKKFFATLSGKVFCNFFESPGINWKQICWVIKIKMVIFILMTW